MVVGAAGIIYSIRAHLDAAKRPSWIMSLLMVLTWGLVGYDIYARARVPVSDHSSYYELDQRWGAYHYTEIWNQSFENTRVPLDGYKYRHCSFKDVTFTYEGKGPAVIEDSVIAGPYRLESLNPPVKQAMINLGQLIGATGQLPEMSFRPYFPWELTTPTPAATP
jgi:hypothetical protein